MRKSDEIGELAKALAAAQSKIEAAVKDATNPHFKSSYATLQSVWDACRETLAKNGLSVVQLPESDERGMFLETVLLHTSGQWIASESPLVGQLQNMQHLGSALTYARRYGLAAMVGVVADEDDDGNAASEPQASAERASAPLTPRSTGRIACPQCGVEAVIKSKYAAKGGPYKGQFPRVCVKTFGGCGAEFSPDGPMPDPKSNDVPQYIRANGESVPIPAINDHHLDAAIAALEKGLASAESVNGNTVATLDALKAEKAARIKKDAEDLGF